MLLLALSALALAGAQDDSELDRLVLCQAYHEQWQWDLRNAGQKVFHDGEWFVPFHRRLLAAAEAAGVDRDTLARRNNSLVDTMRKGLTPDQLADWERCQAEYGWKPDASGETYEF